MPSDSSAGQNTRKLHDWVWRPHADRQTDRQTDRETHTLTHTGSDKVLRK